MDPISDKLPAHITAKNLLNPNINIPTILEMFGAGAEAYDSFLKNNNWEEFVLFLENLNGFPKERIPRKKNVVYRVIKQLEIRFGQKNRHSRDFSAIANSVDDILKLDAGPQGALLQNMIKGCVQRIADLEAASSVLNPDKKTEDSIVKYVGEIRNLMEAVSKYHRDTVDTREQIARQVKAEVHTVMDAVKDAVMALFPAKIEDFQKILISKLTQYKKDK
jgi:hypothetical protein